jgi:uncharacterized protein (UPF0335 family)
MLIGSNSATILKDVVTKLVDIENQLLDLKEEGRAKKQEMKKYKLPVVELLRVSKQNLDKAADKAKNLQDAAGILGVEVYSGFVKPDAPLDFADDVQTYAKELVGQYEAIEEQVAALKEEAKAQLKIAKGAEFVPDVVKTIVQIKLDADAGIESYRNRTNLVEAYLQVL